MRRRRFAAQRQNLCTTEALRHGETQKIDELFWPPGTLGLFQGAVSLFQTSSHQQKAEDTEAMTCRRRPSSGPNLRKKTRDFGMVIRRKAKDRWLTLRQIKNTASICYALQAA